MLKLFVKNKTRALVLNEFPMLYCFCLNQMKLPFTYKDIFMSLKETLLHSWHVAQNAKMGEFAGWDMPIQYKGILAEHAHTRTKASVFDICHMGQFFLRQPGSTAALSKALTHNFETLQVGKCRYGFLLTDEGTVLDDLIVYRLADEHYLLVVNAGCSESDYKIIKERINGLELQDVTRKSGKIDLQGPLSCQILEEVLGQEFKDLGYFSFKYVEWQGADVLVSRTGYTGELGYEIYPVHHTVVKLWEALVAHPDVEPAGLGARDTLRLEAGLPLYGHELDTEHTPTEAGMGAMLKSEADYVGKAGAKAEPKEILVALQAEGKRAARNGDAIALASDEETVIGRVVSGSFAPSINASIAFAYVKAEYANESSFLMKAARTNILAQKVELPFYKEGTARIKF